MKNVFATTIVLFVLAGSCVKDDLSTSPISYNSKGISIIANSYDEGKKIKGMLQKYTAKPDSFFLDNDSIVYTWSYESKRKATSFSYSGNTANLLADTVEWYTVSCQAHLYKGKIDTLLYGSVSYKLSDPVYIGPLQF